METLPAVAVIVALVLGMCIGLIIYHYLSKTKLEAALSKSGAEMQAKLASSATEVHQLNQVIESRTNELRDARAELSQVRQERDGARNEVATLNERAARLPQVEAQIIELRIRATEDASTLAALREEIGQLRSNLGHATSTFEAGAEELRVERKKRETLADEHASLVTSFAKLEQQLHAERDTSEEKLRLLDEARQVLSDQFKLVASEIMETNATRFAEQSQTNLGTVLDPLRERLVEFQRKVEEVYVNEGKDRAALKEQVQQLVDLNNQLSDDAKNLTSALRGSNKSQGNWGEMILQRILEDAGLRNGFEFVLQDAQTSEDGRRQQPDVVIQLPEGRKIVVDAKVSLIAFEKATSAETEDEKQSAMKEHISSLRAHVKGLSDREYAKLYGVTLDFVVMFVPIEPAFMLAIAQDERLCADAWSRNVLLVSPSTLLFVLRTVAYLWRQEAQSKNAKEIAHRGSQLYDKLVGFVADLESVGAKIDGAQHSFLEARKKLSTGKGSVIRQAEMLRELGVKPTRHLSRHLIDEVDDELPALLAGGEETEFPTVQ